MFLYIGGKGHHYVTQMKSGVSFLVFLLTLLLTLSYNRFFQGQHISRISRNLGQLVKITDMKKIPTWLSHRLFGKEFVSFNDERINFLGHF